MRLRVPIEQLTKSSRWRVAAASGRRARVALLLITLVAAAGAACGCTPNKHTRRATVVRQSGTVGCRVRDGGDPAFLSPRRGRSGRGRRAARRRRERRSRGRQGAPSLTGHERSAAVMRGLQSLLASGVAVNEMDSVRYDWGRYAQSLAAFTYIRACSLTARPSTRGMKIF
jgi:hypothetical protein